MSAERVAVETVTLDTNGAGSVKFTSRKSFIAARVTKVVVEMDITTTGSVTLFKNGGQFLTSRTVGTKMEAYGAEPLYTSEFITCQILGGPTSAVVTVTFFYEEVPDGAAALSRSVLKFEEQPQITTGTLIINRTGDLLTGAAGYGPFFVGGMPYLRIYAEAPVPRARVQIQWFVDQAMTQSVGTDAVTTPGGGNSARNAFPVRGGWVRFVVDLAAYANTIIFHAFLVSAQTSDNTGGNGTNHLIAVDGVAVGAGATSTQDANSTRGGPGWWNAGFDGAAAAGLIKLYMVSFSGGTTLLDVMNGPDLATNMGRPIQIPAMPLRITALNSGAAARNLYAVASYRLPPL